MAEPRTQTHCPWNIAAQVRFGLSIMNCPAVSPAARATDAHVSPGLTTWSPVQRTLTAGGSGARARPVVVAAAAAPRLIRRPSSALPVPAPAAAAAGWAAATTRRSTAATTARWSAALVAMCAAYCAACAGVDRSNDAHLACVCGYMYGPEGKTRTSTASVSVCDATCRSYIN